MSRLASVGNGGERWNARRASVMSERRTSWLCPACGRQVPVYVEGCRCGVARELALPGVEIAPRAEGGPGRGDPRRRRPARLRARNGQVGCPAGCCGRGLRGSSRPHVRGGLRGVERRGRHQRRRGADPGQARRAYVASGGVGQGHDPDVPAAARPARHTACAGASGDDAHRGAGVNDRNAGTIDAAGSARRR